MKRKQCAYLMALLAALTMPSCAAEEQPTAPQPTATMVRENAVSWPRDKLAFGDNGIPTVSVYVADDESVTNESVESYLEGVLAGEMKNDWPLEALKAQAILARTYMLKFVAEKTSKYAGADISTDIEEAQAYAPAEVNDRIRQAVAETRGMVLSYGGELPYAWFHAHSGGMTERAKVGLGWNKDEPPYVKVTTGNEPSPESLPDAPELAEAASWEASFTFEQFENAAAQQGKTIDLASSDTIKIATYGDGGRADTIFCDNQTLDAAALRIALGSTKMRSTLLTSLRLNGSEVLMAGKGYGHGVGMSQWGAYGMAKSGKTAEDIVTYYFNDVTVEKLW